MPMLRDGCDEGFDPVIAAFIHDDPRSLADSDGLEEVRSLATGGQGFSMIIGLTYKTTGLLLSEESNYTVWPSGHKYGVIHN